MLTGDDVSLLEVRADPPHHFIDITWVQIKKEKEWLHSCTCLLNKLFNKNSTQGALAKDEPPLCHLVLVLLLGGAAKAPFRTLLCPHQGHGGPPSKHPPPQ